MDTWHRILDCLSQQASPESVDNWLRPLKSLDLEADGTLCLEAPNASVRDLVDSEYRALILQAAEQSGEPVRRLQISAPETPDRTPSSNGQTPVQSTFEFKDRLARFKPEYTFDGFVVGSCNEFAHAAARGVAANPARTFNPLYIYGGVGMGKTHLMHAIGQQLLRSYPAMRVVYVTSEQFMNEMISSLRYDRMSSFHERFRTTDALLIDDIQILGTRERTQEEFFHTFNALHSLQKQIVISSDSPPKEIPGLVDRLRSRFTWGLMADIQPPDLETKMAILDRKAEVLNIRISDAVRSYVATHLKSNIRELEGALIRLGAVSSLSGSEITVAMAKQALRSLLGDSASKVTITAIQRAAAEHYGLEERRLREKSNAKSIAFPRQVAMYLSRELLGSSLQEIGKAFGGKHHTTVLHAVNKIEKLRHEDDAVNNVIHTLTDRFS